MDLFGKFKDFDDRSDHRNCVVQINDYCILDRKTNRIYVTDEMGRMFPLQLSNGRELMDNLLFTGQAEVIDQVLDLISEADLDIGDN